MEAIPNAFLRADIRLHGERTLMFASDLQLELLGTVRTWYLDGTFKAARDPFHQLFTIHGFVRQGACTKQVPLVYCMMTKRRAIDYNEVHNYV